MVKYYHGTHCERVKNIKNQGLRIAEFSSIHVEAFGKKPAVYLTKDLDAAIYYGYDASKDVPAEYLEQAQADYKNICVIEINCLAKGEKAIPDGYGDFKTFKSIPSKCIGKILYPKDLKSMGLWEWD